MPHYFPAPSNAGFAGTNGELNKWSIVTFPLNVGGAKWQLQSCFRCCSQWGGKKLPLCINQDVAVLESPSGATWCCAGFGHIYWVQQLSHGQAAAVKETSSNPFWRLEGGSALSLCHICKQHSCVNSFHSPQERHRNSSVVINCLEHWMSRLDCWGSVFRPSFYSLVCAPSWYPLKDIKLNTAGFHMVILLTQYQALQMYICVHCLMYNLSRVTLL